MSKKNKKMTKSGRRTRGLSGPKKLRSVYLDDRSYKIACKLAIKNKSTFSSYILNLVLKDSASETLDEDDISPVFNDEEE